jgi:hypothetical protein
MNARFRFSAISIPVPESGFLDSRFQEPSLSAPSRWSKKYRGPSRNMSRTHFNLIAPNRRLRISQSMECSSVRGWTCRAAFGHVNYGSYRRRYPTNIVDCHIEGGRSSGLLRTIPWEILESPGISSIGSGAAVHVRRVFGGNPSSDVRTIGKLTVLLVTSRFSDREDIPHRVVSLPLVSIVRQPDNRFVDVQLLRPGTWDAFREALEQASYDMVHLDVHGAVIDSPTGKR